jgi:hypothetical protein
MVTNAQLLQDREVEVCPGSEGRSVETMWRWFIVTRNANGVWLQAQNAQEHGTDFFFRVVASDDG